MVDRPADIPRFEPARWLVCFSPKSDYPWVNRLVPGKFKHVSAFGWVEAWDCWLFVEHAGPRLFVEVVPHGDLAHERMNRAMSGCTVVVVPRGFGTQFRFRPLNNCVSTIGHLIGLRRSALLPDGLYRNCLAYGGQILEARPDAVGTEAGPEPGG
jgi:hypothetical protein